MSARAEGLRARIREQTRRALSSGDLQPTPTEHHEVRDAGIRFSVRVIVGPDRKKPSLREQKSTGVDPFAPPYTDELFVADLSDTHVALLNKFPVQGDHLLVVTRTDEPQQSWLSAADFDALGACMRQIGGLGFYNGGASAGASQPHKHLQLVPMSLATASLLASEERGFASAQASVEPDLAGAALSGIYRKLMQALGLDAQRDGYNLLLTADRMVIVPRTQHAWQGIALNALGYAGSLLVRSASQLERLREIGPVRWLQRAGRET